jgi:hypothetical protein
VRQGPEPRCSPEARALAAARLACWPAPRQRPWQPADRAFAAHPPRGRPSASSKRCSSPQLRIPILEAAPREAVATLVDRVHMGSHAFAELPHPRLSVVVRRPFLVLGTLVPRSSRRGLRYHAAPRSTGFRQESACDRRRRHNAGMRRSRSLLPIACASFWAVSVAIACSDGDTSRPAELGNCVPVGDAACKVAVGGGGSPGGPSGEDSGQGGESDGGTAGCGTADTLLGVTNTTCEPCIQDNCCQAAAACTGSCLALLECMNSFCGSPTLSTFTNCVNSNCGSQLSSAPSAYLDFVACIDGQCMPPTECPMLPTMSPVDF